MARTRRALVAFLLLLGSAVVMGGRLPGSGPPAGDRAGDPPGRGTRAEHPAPDAAGPWGEAVDGLACRLTVRPRYAIGQPITAVIEVKNTSDRTRYLVPRLDPVAVEHLAVEVVGPGGKKVPQTQSARGHGLGEKSFEALRPG